LRHRSTSANGTLNLSREAKALKSLEADADGLEAALDISAEQCGGVLMVEAARQVYPPTRGGLAGAGAD
jgi:hypothetical protein